ncbi:MAG: hypothetical protein AAGI27_03530 [Pseudomonadota bacterium]
MKSLLFTGIVVLGASSALADPIKIVDFDDNAGDGGYVGGYQTELLTDTSIEGDCVESPTAVGGDVCFQGKDGAASDVSYVKIGNGEGEVDWWQYAHGGVFVTNQRWIEILLPAHTRAFSVWVGASFSGRAWVQASDGTYYTHRPKFGVGPGNTSGYGFHTSAHECTSLTKIIIDPDDWGFGNMSINQGECSQVSEPAPLTLALAGLLGIGLARRMKKNKAA